MGKRSNFVRHDRDFYVTPYKAVEPLLPFLKEDTYFCEPCAGNGALVRHLESNDLVCSLASDIEPQEKNITKYDAFDLEIDTAVVDYVITNPPWARNILHPMIDHFKDMVPTWLLFDSDWMFTRQAIPYLKYCSDIVSVGRISWMDNGQAGMDNCAWYRFYQSETTTTFHAAMSKPEQYRCKDAPDMFTDIET